MTLDPVTELVRTLAPGARIVWTKVQSRDERSNGCLVPLFGRGVIGRSLRRVLAGKTARLYSAATEELVLGGASLIHAGPSMPDLVVAYVIPYYQPQEEPHE
jgi:hypothetical protein